MKYPVFFKGKFDNWLSFDWAKVSFTLITKLVYFTTFKLKVRVLLVIFTCDHQIPTKHAADNEIWSMIRIKLLLNSTLKMSAAC